MSERESEIISKLDRLLEMHQTTQGDIRELKGQMSVMMMWMQSIDQRFTALMAPVNPPRKPAA